MLEKVADESLLLMMSKVISDPALRYAAFHCTKSIFYNFFFLQYKAVLLPGRIPVSPVDHSLDSKIPFTPKRVTVYLDFIAFWLRSLGFFLRTYENRGIKSAAEYIASIARVYNAAAEVYTKNLSTTDRPRYLVRLRFILIHLFDPHLMCIPSLHVMVVIRTYTKFRELISTMGDAERFSLQIEEVKQGAVKITEAILYVKQHSINCVAAGMYAMTRFDPPLFPPEEAKDFVSRLFSGAEIPNAEDTQALGEYMLELYTRFLEEGENADTWEAPLLEFLRTRRPDKLVTKAVRCP